MKSTSLAVSMGSGCSMRTVIPKISYGNGPVGVMIQLADY